MSPQQAELLRSASKINGRRIQHRGVHPPSLQRLEASVLDMIPFPLTVIGADGVITYVNRAHESFYGFFREELVGAEPAMFLPFPEERDELSRQLNSKEAEGDRPEYTYGVHQPRDDGDCLCVQVEWRYVLDEQRAVEHIMWVTHDLNRMKNQIRSLYEQRLQEEHSMLTPRQGEVFDRILETKTMHEIGDELGISNVTVGVHSSAVYRKLGFEHKRALLRHFLGYNWV